VVNATWANSDESLASEVRGGGYAVEEDNFSGDDPSQVYL